MPNVESPLARDPETLKLDIQKPPPIEELIQWVSEIMRTPQSTSKVVRPKKKKVPSSPPAPTREDHPEDELSPPWTVERLHQLSLVALNSKIHATTEVGTTPPVNSYFLILNMNGLLLEKRPSLNGRNHVYSFREDVGEFLEFFMRNFKVVFWSCCNQRNLKSIFQALKNVCSRNCTRKVQRCRAFD